MTKTFITFLSVVSDHRTIGDLRNAVLSVVCELSTM